MGQAAAQVPALMDRVTVAAVLILAFRVTNTIKVIRVVTIKVIRVVTINNPVKGVSNSSLDIKIIRSS